MGCPNRKPRGRHGAVSGMMVARMPPCFARVDVVVSLHRTGLRFFCLSRRQPLLREGVMMFEPGGDSAARRGRANRRGNHLSRGSRTGLESCRPPKADFSANSEVVRRGRTRPPRADFSASSELVRRRRTCTPEAHLYAGGVFRTFHRAEPGSPPAKISRRPIWRPVLSRSPACCHVRGWNGQRGSILYAT